MTDDTIVMNSNQYGEWNCLDVHNERNDIIDKIPAHDGDFYPENPQDHIEVVKNCLQNNYSKSWPVRVDIDIIQRCTSNCYFCYSRRYANDLPYKGAEISLIQFEKIISELSINGTKSIRFTGGGEPLCHADIKKILKIPRKYGLKSCLITNGDLLNNELIEIIVANIDHVRISINASNDDVRAQLHKTSSNGNSLSNILKQIKYMISLRDSEKKEPLFWLTFLLLPENIKYVFEAAKISNELGVDSISFRPVYHELSHKFAREELEILPNQLKLAKQLNNPPYFKVFVPKRNINDVWHMNPSKIFKKCISCYTRTIIESTNSGPMVSICGLKRGHPDERIGFIADSFSKLWLDNIYRFQDIIHTCDRCIDISINNTLNKIENHLKNDINILFSKNNY